jgi:hypothetical protein
VSAPTEDLRLLVDPSFRCSVALSHAVRGLLLELHLDDGRRLPVSHDPAFAPVLSPCHVRLALSQAAVGAAPGWLAAVVGWSVGGPFAEPLGGGVVAVDRVEDGRTATLATTLSPMVVAGLAAAVDTGDDALEVRVSPDAAVSASVVAVSGDGIAASMVDLGAVLLADRCRAREHALRSASRR